jgi:RNA polymerase sigma-70 factor (ECF subfamily)
MGERALGSKSDAEDLVQDTFARLLRAVKGIREPGSLRSFVYSCGVRALKSQLRRRHLRAWLSFDAPDSMVDLRHATPDVEAREVLKRFYALLDRLSPRDRLVFMLRRVEAMTVEEIAENMAISPSTVKRSLTHASERLSRWIDLDPKLADLVDRKLRGRLE